jgi:hypothetical protein
VCKGSRIRSRSSPLCAALIASLVALGFFASTASAQQPGPPNSLAARQKQIVERVTRLESIMLSLSTSLAAAEPEKAERIRDAIDHAGKRRIRERVEQIATQLAQSKLGDAERSQQALIVDLDELLRLLTSPSADIDARRAERRRLEALKRSIRKLVEEQTSNLYRAQHAAQRYEAAEPSNETSPNDPADNLRTLEQEQRETQRKAAEAARQARGPARPPEEPARPGAEPMEKAVESMRQAAEKLGEAQPRDALVPEQQAVEHLGTALEELEDALRQVRKEEVEETLAALEARLAAMVAAEKQVRDSLTPLADPLPTPTSRTDQLRLDEAIAKQELALGECDAAVRVLADEGSTVLVPELLRQIAADMRIIRASLGRNEAGSATRGLVGDVIAALEEMRAAVEKRRSEASPPPAEPGQPAPQPGPETQPLLPKSAELKMMRSAQVRILGRMPDDAPASTDGPLAAIYAELSGRQRTLSGLAQRLHERSDPP